MKSVVTSENDSRAEYKSTGIFPDGWVQEISYDVYEKFWNEARDLAFEFQDASDWLDKRPADQARSFANYFYKLIEVAAGDFASLLTQVVYAHRRRITAKTAREVTQEAVAYADYLANWNCSGAFLGWALGGTPVEMRNRIELDYRSALELQLSEHRCWWLREIDRKIDVERLRSLPVSGSAKEQKDKSQYVAAMGVVAKSGLVGFGFWQEMEQRGFETPKILQKQECPRSIRQASKSSTWRKKLNHYKYEKTKRRSD